MGTLIVYEAMSLILDFLTAIYCGNWDGGDIEGWWTGAENFVCFSLGWSTQLPIKSIDYYREK